MMMMMMITPQSTDHAARIARFAIDAMAAAQVERERE
jgi:hypothetical protein